MSESASSLPEGESPERAALADYGSWPAVLGLLAVSIVFGGLLTVPIALAFLSGGGIGSTDQFMASPVAVFLAILLEDLVLVGLVYLLLVRRRVTGWREMGLTGPRSPGFIIKGAGWGLLFVVLAGLVEMVQRSFGLEQTQAQMFPLEGSGTLGRVAILFAGVVLAPLAEEIFFRGYLFRAVTARKGLARGVVYSSLIFGSIHLNLGAFLPIAVGSAVLALAYHRSGDLWVPITAHAFNNAAAFGLLLLA